MVGVTIAIPHKNLFLKALDAESAGSRPKSAFRKLSVVLEKAPPSVLGAHPSVQIFQNIAQGLTLRRNRNPGKCNEDINDPPQFRVGSGGYCGTVIRSDS